MNENFKSCVAIKDREAGEEIPASPLLNSNFPHSSPKLFSRKLEWCEEAFLSQPSLSPLCLSLSLSPFLFRFSLSLSSFSLFVFLSGLNLIPHSIYWLGIHTCFYFDFFSVYNINAPTSSWLHQHTWQCFLMFSFYHWHLIMSCSFSTFSLLFSAADFIYVCSFPLYQNILCSSTL